MRNAALAVAVIAAAAVLFSTRGRDAPPDARTGTTVADRVETVASLDPVLLYAPRELDDVLVVTQPLGEGHGVVVTIDLAARAWTERRADGADFPIDLGEPTHDPAYADAEAAARSPDGTRIAVFTRSDVGRSTGISIWTAGRPAREFHHLSSVGDVVSGRLVWSRDGDVVYLLAASTQGSADRIIAVPLGRGAQTVASFRERGFYGLGTV